MRFAPPSPAAVSLRSALDRLGMTRCGWFTLMCDFFGLDPNAPSLMSRFAPIKDFGSVTSILSKISLFGAVSGVQLKEVLNRLESGIFRRGEYIFQRGGEPTHIYIVKSGKINLQIMDRDVVVAEHRLGIGECFGEASLFAMHKHTATAVAIENTEIIALSRHALISLQQEDIELFALMMMNSARDLARRLKSTNEILLHYVHSQKRLGNE